MLDNHTPQDYCGLMRNLPKPLGRTASLRQSFYANRLKPLVGTDKVVCLTYVKRDGSVSSSTGTVGFFNGRPGYDTGSVTIADPIKGNRTINLHRITNIQ